jgi:ariadne-1
MGRDAEELLSPPASSPEPEQDDDDEDCYLSDQEDDALEESVLQVLEDGHLEDCHWSASSVRPRSSPPCPPPID